jgi:hypothetical protein
MTPQSAATDYSPGKTGYAGLLDQAHDYPSSSVESYSRQRSKVAWANRYLLLWVLLAAAGLALAIGSVRLAGMPADDAFIHRRIALNYQHLGQPYFNVNQRVMVTSSPLWTLLLAAAGAILPVANPVPWLEWVFVLLGAAAAYLLVLHTKERESYLSSLVFASLAFVCVFAGVFPSAISQMESPCAIALMLGGVLGIAGRKSWGMPLLLLACFSRYECVLLFAGAGIWVTWRRQWTWPSLLACCGIGGGGVAWLLREYGTLIPNTVVAKSHLYIMSYREVAGGLLVHKTGAVLCFTLGVLWWSYGRNRNARPNPSAVLLAGFGASLAAAYLVRKTFVFSWYLPLVWVPLAMGVLLWTNRKQTRAAIMGAGFSAAMLLPLLASDVSLLPAVVRGAPGNMAGFAEAARVHEYRRIGEALYQQCPSGVLMTSEIGGLGWGFHGAILDAAGLASPEAIRYHPMRVPEERKDGTLGEIPPGFIRERRPDLIVTYDTFAETALPAARSLGYIDFSYPLFVREERVGMNDLWGARQMHVLVAPDGRCSAHVIDQAVRTALEK